MILWRRPAPTSGTSIKSGIELDLQSQISQGCDGHGPEPNSAFYGSRPIVKRSFFVGALYKKPVAKRRSFLRNFRRCLSSNNLDLTVYGLLTLQKTQKQGISGKESLHETNVNQSVWG